MTTSTEQFVNLKQFGYLTGKFALNKRAAAILTALFCSPVTYGQTCDWSPANGDWEAPSSWTCNAVPGSSDTANIDAGKTSHINSAQSIFNLKLN